MTPCARGLALADCCHKTSATSPTSENTVRTAEMPSPRQIIERLDAERASRVAPSLFDLDQVCFDAQRPFVASRARYQTACCTRRSGKTVGELAKLLDVLRAKPNAVGLYITLSRINAKRLAWETLKSLNAEWKLGGIANESELLLTLPNGARLYLTGCSDMGEVEKFRGLALAIVVIDEAQSFPTLLLQRLIDEVLTPALMDFNGLLVLVGTPGPVPVGYFHDCVVSPEWAHFSWSVFQNPHIERKSGRTPQSMLEDELRRRGVSQDDPVVQREWFGRWVLDPNALVFRFDPTINTRTPLTHERYVMGVDLGFDDADAISVLGWTEKRSPEVDLVHEWVGAKQNITALMGRVKEAYDKYKPLAVVADTGGLGKKIADEISQRTGIPIEAADKLRKLEHIELVNDAFRTHRLFVPADSRFAQDALLLEWDKTNPEKWTISERFHSDAADSLLYAYMRALAWLHVPPEKQPPPMNSPEWHEAEMARQRAEIESQLERQMESNRNEQHQSDNPLAWL